MSNNNDTHYTRFEPWFGSWPPEFRGESKEVEMDKDKNKLAKWYPVVCFVIVGFAGGILLGFKGFWNELGFALIVAGVIGVVIELTFVTQLAKHVFEIAFGYLLRPEIANEVQWIYKLDRLVTDYSHEFTIEKCPENSGKVWIRETIIRTVKNIGDKNQDVKPSLGIQEWFHEEGRSEIIDYQITFEDGKAFSLKNGDIAVERPQKHNQGAYILAIKEDKLDKKLAPDKKFILAATYRELRPVSADTVAFWGVASMNPNITVKIPDDMDYDITFANRNQGELLDLGVGKWQLNSLLLPSQAIRLRWWIRDDSDKWIQEFDEEHASK